MENASKALIMAGAVIVAVMIVTLMVYVFNLFADQAKNNNWSDVEIENFNSKLEPYCGEGISGSQVNALIQLVRSLDTAAKNSEGESLYTTLDLTGVSCGSISITIDPNEQPGQKFKINDNAKNVPTGGTYYNVQPTYDTQMRIEKIQVTQ